jgi:UDP-N-acetylmuramyl pentapeptide phosphotransferase/UDP-N-acetylglucosamine-1-phosphate transferase
VTPGAGTPPWLFALLATAAAFILAAAWRRHALRRQWLDKPSGRGLHEVPTPRGGGVAIAAVLLAAAPALGQGATGFALGLVITAGAGLVDDLRPLRALPKFGLQCAGALPLALAWPLLPGILGPFGSVLAAWLLVLVLVNTWNFMDGSNGLAATQAMLVGVGVLAVVGADSPAGWLGLAMAAGALGFLPFNLPSARLFLGDVGSFALGYGVAAVLLAALREDTAGPWLGLLPLAFLVDAGLTLMGRLRRGERVWLAHRGHLYQRAVQHVGSHGRVCLAYGAWTALAALSAWAVAAEPVRVQAGLLALALLSAVLVYAGFGQRWPLGDNGRPDPESPH